MSTAVTEPLSRDRALRRAFSLYPTGVVALAAMVDGAPVGMAVNSFTSISLEPALVAVSAARTSKTWPQLSSVPELGMSVLAADQESFSRRLSAREGDRFGDQARTVSPGGALLIEGASLWLTCRPHATYDGGDHEIALFEIADVQVFDDVEPLVFHQSRYRSILGDAPRP
ncbi:flavin reductase family protein [Microbacterium capsulatum]|uniref:Flavin reductase family protein n=1 Tax=Microbacterium capsulatum TaxID=3041921 RepID=A0ABU0XEP2_9MICO|nr:flavin reductase family protein [Microbacterium sp. ASV81]MDQ4213568.1 flavin reductase family protein [Microbacterium sp. ASV81]